MSSVSRRDFLKLAQSALLWCSGALGILGIVRYFSYQPDPPPPTRFEVGMVKAYPMDSQTVLPQIPALLIRSREGFKALSLTCTHLGCTLEHTSNTRLTCPCHGSQFDISGSVVQGPAAQMLAFLRVEVTPEEIVVIYNAPV
ncbi:MAG: ubiquinol-cytochrome c reductase iron-sulfur subunit [Anaerolineales bacterium]|jgi:nitrite reductase/ring-hydroxylating ferredoxin subunit|nr:ubiquinol-cytochrome c reductase iron-sulfur subunit [Anaerolineales bacterium]